MKMSNQLINEQKTLMLLALLFIGASSSSASQTDSVQSCDAKVTIEKQGVTVPLRQGGKKHRYLDVNINGTIFNAVVDTGGMGIGGLISETSLSSLEINNQSLVSMTANGAHGASGAKRLNIAKTSIGDASVENLMFMTTANPVIPEDSSPVLIGSRFLCQFLVMFDFSKNTLSFHDRSTKVNKITKESEQWHSYPFENFYNTGGIIFEMKLNGKKVKAALDTGSPFTGINWKAANLAGIDKNSNKLRKYQVAAHSLNATEPTMVNETDFILSLINNQLARNDTKVRINDNHAFKQIFANKPGIILGLPFFEQRKIIIDYANSRLYISEA